MRIGLDVKWYFDGHPSGKRISQNIVLALLKMNLKDEIILFLDKKFKEYELPLRNQNIKCVYIWANNNLLSNLIVIPFYSWKEKIDVLISNNFSPISGKYKRITLILDVIFKSHPEYFTLKERIYFAFIKPLALLADHICTISFSEKNRMLKYGFSSDENKITVIHLGIESKFKLKNKHDLSYLDFVKEKYKLPDKYLLYVGRLNQRKNLNNLLKAYSILKKELCSIPLVLGGTPDWKMFDIKRYAADLQIDKDIIFTGFVSDKDLPGLYALASIFCYVSYEEGFGLPPLESMASGVPVVVSNTSSLPEVCGEAGVYCNPFDPNDIANKIKMLLEDKDLFESKKKLGLEQAIKFDWKDSAENLLKISETISSITVQ